MTLITSTLHKALLRHLEDFPNPIRVDVISSYIRKEGLDGEDGVLPVFKKLEQQGTKIRVFTTLQRKITDVWSLDKLAKLQNTSVYIFWPKQPNFHAKGWLFLYEEGEHHPDDTVVIGSSNITRTGVRVAVDCNVLLQRKSSQSDASKIIDEFDKTFSKYIQGSQFTGPLHQWEVDCPEYEGVKAIYDSFLLTDDELIEKYASPEVQSEWKELKVEQSKIVEDVRHGIANATPIEVYSSMLDTVFPIS